MKTKAQKQKELEKGKKLLNESKFLVFTDFTNVTAENLRRFRRELKGIKANFLVIKKRLLNLLLKEKGIDFDIKTFKFSVGTVFSPVELEKASSSVFKFFKELGVEKDKILGGYDVEKKSIIEKEQISFLGQLPSREVLLGQLLGTMIGPLRAFLYLLSEKSKMVENKNT